MKLTKNQIEQIAVGIVEVKNIDKYVRLYRFNEEQIAMFLEYNGGEFSEKTHSSAGARLAFTTDSKTLKLKGNISLAGARYYYAIDVAINGILIFNLYNLVFGESNFIASMMFWATVIIFFIYFIMRYYIFTSFLEVLCLLF